MAIKIGLKKLVFDGNTNEIADLMKQNCFQLLNISIGHTTVYESLEFVHRDPFDRILVAQAIVEKMIIITRDENIQRYSVKTNW